MSNRLNFREILPDTHKVFMQLSQAVANSGVDILHQELIKIRASQINGCAYCLHKHSKDALKHGENPDRLYVIAAWREAKNWFSEKDQIVLKLTEEITLISNHGLSDQTYEEAIALFGEEMTAKLIAAAININALNRLGVGLSLHP